MTRSHRQQQLIGAYPPVHAMSTRTFSTSDDHPPSPKPLDDSVKSPKECNAKRLPSTQSRTTPSPTRKRAPWLTREDVYTIPNMLSTLRLVLAPCVGYQIIQGDLKLAFGMFCIAGITDLVHALDDSMSCMLWFSHHDSFMIKLDGYIARRWNSKTFFGSIIDPVADKTLMTVMTVTLAQVDLLPGKEFSYNEVMIVLIMK
jgi:cardiolipin synthase